MNGFVDVWHYFAFPLRVFGVFISMSLRSRLVD